MARIVRSIGFAAAVALAAMLALVQVVGAQATDAIDASDQPIVGGEITVAKVTAAQDGWIVAHLDEGGAAGKVLGQTAVKKGDNANVKIKLSQDVPVGGKLWPMLHIDAGKIGTYEFPGPDAPVKDAAGNIVMMQIAVTAAATTAGPATLPKTGGADGPLGLALAALALLGAGALTLRMRRASYSGERDG